MPSRRTKSAAINERISQAQKERTRLACRVCRARRIKCDGQKEMCGRCKVDKRTDCSYENVGSIERLAGRQRKRALRKQHTTNESVGSTSRETAAVVLDPTLNKTCSSTMTSNGGVMIKSEWPSLPPNLTIHPSLPLHHHQQHSPIQDHHHHHLVQNLYPSSYHHHHHSFPFQMDMDNNSSNGGHGHKQPSLTPISSHSSSTNHLDEAFQSSYVTSFASSASSPGNPAIGSGNLENGSFQNSSWMSLSPTLPVQQNHQVPLQNSTTTTTTTPLNIVGNGSIQQQLHSFPSDYQSGHENDFASMDSLWRVYDWQYRCGNNALPSQYPPLSTGVSSFPG